MSARVRIALALGLGGTLGLLAIGFTLHRRDDAERQREQQATEFIARVDAATLTLARCVTDQSDPSQLGRGLREQLRKGEPDEFRRKVSACKTAFRDEIDPQRRALGLHDALEYRDSGSPLDQWTVCQHFNWLRSDREAWLSDLGLVGEPMPALDCWGPLAEARRLDVPEGSKADEHDSGGLVVEHDHRHGWAEPERGVVTWFTASDPSFRSHGLPLEVVGSQAHLLGDDPDGLVLGSWTDLSGKAERFEARRFDIPSPTVFRATPERWYFVSEREGAIDIHFSDDAGQSMTTRTTALRGANHYPLVWSHARGKQLTVSFVGEHLLELVHVDAKGEVSTSELALARERGLEFMACATDGGAMALLDDRVLHLGETPKLVKDLAPARTRALACVDDRAFVAVDDGASLQRLVCDAAGCADPTLLMAEGELDVALRSSEGGVHVLVLGDPTQLYIVDQPLGGELERVEGLTRSLSLDRLPAYVDGMLIPRPVQAPFSG